MATILARRSRQVLLLTLALSYLIVSTFPIVVADNPLLDNPPEIEDLGQVETKKGWSKKVRITDDNGIKEVKITDRVNTKWPTGWLWDGNLQWVWDYEKDFNKPYPKEVELFVLYKDPRKSIEFKVKATDNASQVKTEKIQNPRIPEEELAVGGFVVPVDKFALLAPYIGLASTILVATVATIIYIRRIKKREKNNGKHISTP